MINNYEKIYLKHKKKNIINLVSQFKEKYGQQAFLFDLTQNTVNLEEVFCNSKLCSNCGECCSNAPCIFSPYDFLDICDIDYMRNILNTGLICISKSPNDEKTLILRPRGRQDVKSIYSRAYNRNHCILENGKGCMLPAQYRPCQGLLQVPRDDKGVTLHSIMYPDYKLEHDYIPFQKVLETLIYEYRNNSIPNYEDKMEESVKSFIKSLVRYDKNCK